MSNDHARPTAAVTALNIQEILCRVFEVDSAMGNDRRFLRRELLRCALVSRAFCEPALRTLWNTMSPPTPLWRLLADIGPQSKWINGFEFFYALYPQILSEKTYRDPARWARFMWYARFVQTLSITTFCMENKHKKLIHALVEHNGGESIFPALRTLEWPPSSYSDSSYFLLFTPRLRSATIDFHQCTPRDKPHPDEDPQSHTFLSQLRTSSPRLDHLSVSTSLQRIGTNHSRLIASFEHLTNLHLSARISHTSFLELAAIPRLESLCIFHVRSDDPKLEPSRSDPGAYIHASHLAHFSIGGTCSSLTALFTALYAPILASASVHVMWDDPPRTSAHGYVDYVACIGALATVASPAALALTDLALELEEDGGPRMCEYLLSLLDPLLAFPSVTRFELSCTTVGLVAVDDDFWLVTEAWPKLREFRLCEAYWDPRVHRPRPRRRSDADEFEGRDGLPIPTAQVLECFREDCPDLRELRLPHLDVHADVPGLFTYVPKGRRVGHGLGRLWFGEPLDLDEGDDDEDEDQDRVREPVKLDDEKVMEWARYILHLFPKLDAEESLKHCGWSDAAPGWMEVFRQVGGLRKFEEGSSSGRAVAKL